MQQHYYVLVLLFCQLVSARRCRCEEGDRRNIFDTQKCCTENNLGLSTEASILGRDLKMKCGATEAYKQQWPRFTDHEKWWHLSKPEFRGMKPADVPPPDEVECFLECPRDYGYANRDFGPNKAKYGQFYFLEHDLRVEGNVGYCYRDPTPEEWEAQKRWMNRNKDDDNPHHSWKLEYAPSQVVTETVVAGRYHCVERSWDDFKE